MNTLVRVTTMASAVATMAFATAGIASAQSDQFIPCKGHQQDNCADQGVNPDNTGKHRYQNDQGAQGDQYNGNGQANDQQGTPRRKLQQAQSDWQFDPSKHRRHHHRDNVFRFEFGGYWYPQPYWEGGYGLNSGAYGDGYSMSYGVSCRDGRNIVADSGFYRVRPLKCVGRSFVYLGKRHGNAFQIRVSSRSGQIISVRPL